jgi:hypothetical protein
MAKEEKQKTGKAQQEQQLESGGTSAHGSLRQLATEIGSER